MLYLYSIMCLSVLCIHQACSVIFMWDLCELSVDTVIQLTSAVFCLFK